MKINFKKLFEIFELESTENDSKCPKKELTKHFDSDEFKEQVYKELPFYYDALTMTYGNLIFCYFSTCFIAVISLSLVGNFLLSYFLSFGIFDVPRLVNQLILFFILITPPVLFICYYRAFFKKVKTINTPESRFFVRHLTFKKLPYYLLKDLEGQKMLINEMSEEEKTEARSIEKMKLLKKFNHDLEEVEKTFN